MAYQDHNMSDESNVLSRTSHQISMLNDCNHNNAMKEQWQQNLLHKAIHLEANLEVIDSLAKTKHLHQLDEKGRTPLCIAVIYGRWQVVRLLIKRGASRDLRTSCSGDTLLQSAIETDAPYDILEWLATPESVVPETRFGLSPLFVAVLYKRWDLVPLLLQKGATLRIPARMLHLAVRGEAPPHVLDLLATDDNINLQDDLGFTALHHAAMFHRSCLRQLLAKGCDPKIRDDDGRTPLHMATDPAYRGNQVPDDIIKLLDCSENQLTSDEEAEKQAY